MVTYPVFVFDDANDLYIYEEKPEECSLEEPEVRGGIYFGYDSDGFRLALRYERHELILTRGGYAGEEFKQILIEAMTRQGTTLHVDATLDYLMHNVVDSRDGKTAHCWPEV